MLWQQRLDNWRRLMSQDLPALLTVRLNKLEPRERQGVLLAGIALLLIFFYLAIWAPLNGYVESARQDRDRQLSLLQYFQATQAEASAASRGQSGSQLQGQSLLSELSRSAQILSVPPSRMQPEGSDSVSVWYDTVAFTRLTLWLEQLEASKGIQVRQITLDSRAIPGQVSARLVLRH